MPTEVTADEMRDLVCHKAFHAIDSPRLVWIARDKDVIVRLKAVGQGAAAVRLPADFDVERAAKSMQALVRRFKGAGEACNVVVNSSASDTLVETVTKDVTGDPSQKGLSKAQKTLDDFKGAWGSHMAYGGGFLKAMFDATGASRRAMSVLNGYAVSKLEEEYGESWAAGAEHYELARKWRKARAKEGYLVGVGLMGATKPADFAPPDLEVAPAAKSVN
jgi:hypothetical protein